MNWDHDYELEKMYNPDREDTTRYEQAEREFEDARGEQRVNVVTRGRVLSKEEFEQMFER